MRLPSVTPSVFDVRPSLRFAISGPADASAAAFSELRGAIVRAGGPDVDALYLPSYASLYETVSAGLTDLAWAPPLVALDLERGQLATLVAATMRAGGDAYYSALIVRGDSPIAHVGQVAGARVGWVSKLSAAGYVVPRFYLQSLGMSLDGLFSSEAFFPSHARLAEALASGEIDVAATYAALRGGAFVPAPVRVPVRLLATAGPIPGDVVLASARVNEVTVRMLTQALPRCHFKDDGPLAKLLGVERLAPAPSSHLAPLERWSRRADSVFKPISRAPGALSAPAPPETKRGSAC